VKWVTKQEGGLVVAHTTVILTADQINDLEWAIEKREITLCETCDDFFAYVPQKRFCDDCRRQNLLKRNQRPEVKERKREYQREHRKQPKYKKWSREYYQRPEVKERNRVKSREYYRRKKRGSGK